MTITIVPTSRKPHEAWLPLVRWVSPGLIISPRYWCWYSWGRGFRLLGLEFRP